MLRHCTATFQLWTRARAGTVSGTPYSAERTFGVATNPSAAVVDSNVSKNGDRKLYGARKLRQIFKIRRQVLWTYASN
ncbi:unnamed protein product [Angiostrongylus costaricensis]|uniref:Secreted protein n=1 Tax=Angiostrongylus costaricensis TaxID=334426 RepID=A0A0R3PK36_ANGCS|nr:unnamed protein product [Angiostrongylus costaricensis]